LEHGPTIDQCTRLDVAELYSANANCKAARPFEPALEQKEIAVRQQVGIAHVEIFGALDREAPRSWSADQKRPQVSIRIEAALGNGDQRARERVAFGHKHKGFNSLVRRK